MSQMVLPNISWKTYERILDEIGETHYRVTYNNGELEFMTLSLEHESFGEWITKLIFFAAFEFHIKMKCGGSTTLKKSLLNVGLEPDRCYWIKHEKRLRGKRRWNADTDPPPDLAVEIDITSSWLDRMGIYAELKVPEVWRFDGEVLKILILGTNGKYRERSRSEAFPWLPMDRFVEFIVRLNETDEMTLFQEFVTWLRDEVLPSSQPKNGKR